MTATTPWSKAWKDIPHWDKAELLTRMGWRWGDEIAFQRAREIALGTAPDLIAWRKLGEAKEN